MHNKIFPEKKGPHSLKCPPVRCDAKRDCDSGEDKECNDIRRDHGKPLPSQDDAP
jgi:hypothetical protein